MAPLMWGCAIVTAVIVGTFLPFVPGGHDPLAVPLAAVAWALGRVGLLLVPVGALWLWVTRRHGSFLNADNTYIHENKSFRGFGSYGDILVRDRKMYVAPTPFALVDGTAHRRTLILPADEPVESDLVQVGTLMRREADEIAVSYSFDLRTRQIETRMIPNPGAGNVHVFSVYRASDDPNEPVTMRDKRKVLAELEAQVEEEPE